jgi:hypothetical protein
MIGNDLNILLLRLEQLQFDEFTAAANASNFRDTVTRAARRVYNTRFRMSAEYVAARCEELLALCGEMLEPPPTDPPATVPPGGVSQRRQMQRLRQALLGQEPAKVRLVAWLDRDIRLHHCLRRLTGLTGYFDVAEQDAQLKRLKADLNVRQAQLQREQEDLERKERELADQGKLNQDEQKKLHDDKKRLKDDMLETENRRDIAGKLLAFTEAMRLYKERYSTDPYSRPFDREFLPWEQLEMAALVRKLDREWMQFD